MPLHGRRNFPTLHLRLKDLIAVVRGRLVKEGIAVRDVRINGGAASYIIGEFNSLVLDRQSNVLGRCHEKSGMNATSHSTISGEFEVLFLTVELFVFIRLLIDANARKGN